jgi:hypothetical protein
VPRRSDRRLHTSRPRHRCAPGRRFSHRFADRRLRACGTSGNPDPVVGPGSSARPQSRDRARSLQVRRHHRRRLSSCSGLGRAHGRSSSAEAGGDRDRPSRIGGRRARCRYLRGSPTGGMEPPASPSRLSVRWEHGCGARGSPGGRALRRTREHSDGRGLRVLLSGVTSRSADPLRAGDPGSPSGLAFAGGEGDPVRELREKLLGVSRSVPAPPGPVHRGTHGRASRTIAPTVGPRAGPW